jgi:hypothetical protein
MISMLVSAKFLHPNVFAPFLVLYVNDKQMQKNVDLKGG